MQCVTTVLNPAPANATTTQRTARARATWSPPTKPNSPPCVARHVGRTIDADDVAAVDGASLHALCRELLAHGSVVVTLGAAGVFVSHAEEALRGDAKPYYRMAAEPRGRVDTTGAGDAFNGALAASLASGGGLPFAEHVRFANRYAALSTERAGAALAMPRLAEVAARFDGNAAGA